MNSTRRFSLVHHTGAPEGDHFDLFLEDGEILRTWKLSTGALDRPQDATKGNDHRKMYLEYEGPIEGGRGHVRIVQTGEYSIERWEEADIHVVLDHRRRIQLKAGNRPLQWELLPLS